MGIFEKFYANAEISSSKYLLTPILLLNLLFCLKCQYKLNIFEWDVNTIIATCRYKITLMCAESFTLIWICLRECIRGLSQNSVGWVCNFWSVQCILIKFLHNVNWIIFNQNPKFQMCIMLAFWKKLIIFKIKSWTAEHHMTSKCVTLIQNVRWNMCTHYCSKIL